ARMANAAISRTWRCRVSSVGIGGSREVGAGCPKPGSESTFPLLPGRRTMSAQSRRRPRFWRRLLNFRADVDRGTLNGMPGMDPSIPAARARPRQRVCAWLLACAGAWFAPAAPAATLDPALPAERYTVTRWNADDGLPHSQIHA